MAQKQAGANAPAQWNRQAHPGLNEQNTHQLGAQRTAEGGARQPAAHALSAVMVGKGTCLQCWSEKRACFCTLSRAPPPLPQRPPRQLSECACRTQEIRTWNTPRHCQLHSAVPAMPHQLPTMQQGPRYVVTFQISNDVQRPRLRFLGRHNSNLLPTKKRTEKSLTICSPYSKACTLQGMHTSDCAVLHSYALKPDVCAHGPRDDANRTSTCGLMWVDKLQVTSRSIPRFCEHIDCCHALLLLPPLTAFRLKLPYHACSED